MSIVIIFAFVFLTIKSDNIMKKVLFIFASLIFTVSVFSQTYWSASGNAGTNPHINFLGTTDNTPLVIKTNRTLSGFVGGASNSNTAFGRGALEDSNPINNYNSTNTAIGYFTLTLTTSGQKNTGCGANALYWNTTGSNNTALGCAAGVSTGNLSNTTAIGNSAIATASNQIMIGNQWVTSIRGYTSWTNISDGRIKKNIQSNVPGLEFIMKLKPVTYNVNIDAVHKIVMADMPESDLKSKISSIEREVKEAKERRIYTGFIAQDVEKAAKSLGYDFSGVDAAKNDNDLYGLRYSEFVVPLVKSVQELSEQNASLKDQVEKLTEQVNSLLGLIENKSLYETRNSSISDVSLEQNYPNPFTSSTTIDYTLPTTFRSAKIVITSFAGQVVRQMPVSGAGNILVDAGGLSAGIYYYTLYVDDMLVDTKKMVVK